MKNCATGYIDRIVLFAVYKGLVSKFDISYVRNLLLDMMRLDAPEEYAAETMLPRDTVTKDVRALCDIAAERGIIGSSSGDRELFAAKICGCITPSPETVRRRFADEYAVSSDRATDWFYQMCRDCDYIKVDSIAKNIAFTQKTEMGELEITINLSKPEKDPRDIQKAASMPSVNYPRCMLCVENPGYAGRANYPARQNHRIVPLRLAGERYYLQYSPYQYYDEHCIVLNEIHKPMRINETTFVRLLDFCDQFPSYFLGSNADLPIVGGSILSHDHYQGGRHVFPMEKCPVRTPLVSCVPGVTACVIDWPLTCVRLDSCDPGKLVRMASDMLEMWRGYSDEKLGILAYTDRPHNTITPVARRIGNSWRLYLVLRNNRADGENALGIFHPHSDLHQIKKENIGLIEVMGLFILPGRLKRELGEARKFITGERSLSDAPDKDECVHKHFEWIKDIVSRRGLIPDDGAAREALRSELGRKCARVLYDCGVYKDDPQGREGLMRFLNKLGYRTKGE